LFRTRGPLSVDCMPLRFHVSFFALSHTKQRTKMIPDDVQTSSPLRMAARTTVDLLGVSSYITLSHAIPLFYLPSPFVVFVKDTCHFFLFFCRQLSFAFISTPPPRNLCKPAGLRSTCCGFFLFEPPPFSITLSLVFSMDFSFLHNIFRALLPSVTPVSLVFSSPFIVAGPPACMFL